MAELRKESLIWIVPEEWQRNAVTTTMRLLSTLLSRRAVIIAPEAKPSESDIPSIHYSTVESPIEPRVPVDEDFWGTFAETGHVPSPQLTVEWEQSTLPVWSPYAYDIPADLIAASFYHYARLEERQPVKHDSHGRFRAHDSWLVKHGLVERPVVHEYAQGLARHLGIPTRPSRVWRPHDEFAIAFSHDIDRVGMHGPWTQELRSIAGHLVRGDGVGVMRRRIADRRAVRQGHSPDPYDTITRLVKYHRAHEFGATFFWIATEPSVRDADYRCDDPGMRDTIRTVSTPPFESGLHGAYDSYLHADALKTQRNSLEQAAGSPIRSTRQHYLRFRLEDTWRAQQDAGLTVDSTLGFAERIGFRAGLAVPFRPWSFAQDRPHDLWEVPLVMMDVSLKEYMHLDPDAALERSKKMFDTLQQHAGGVSLLWHNSSLNDIDWPGWDGVFDLWLKETQRRGGWGTTVGGLADHWSAYVQNLGNDA